MTDQAPITSTDPVRPDPTPSGLAVTDRPAPDRAGIGMRTPHHRALLETRPAVGWLEIHAENYMGGGAPRHYLEQVRALWPVSVHGVGLGLGGSEPPDPGHLDRLARLVDWLEPALVSEHLAWVGVDGRYYNDLLPLPYTADSLEQCCRNVSLVQDRLKRPILIENPATYLRFRESQIAEAEFLSRMAERTGCGILCDVNNIYVSSVNHVGLEAAPAVAAAYLDSLPDGIVHEIHIAGHAENDADGRLILIDDHGGLVAEPVWQLYGTAVRRFRDAVTLLEWDSNIPPLDHLVAEAAHADRHRAAALSAGSQPESSDERAA